MCACMHIYIYILVTAALRLIGSLNIYIYIYGIGVPKESWGALQTPWRPLCPPGGAHWAPWGVPKTSSIVVKNHGSIFK